jgi:hypothetical protein
VLITTHTSSIHSPNISKRSAYTSMHCVGLDMNTAFFWTYWSTHGFFYTKRDIPREGVLFFHVDRYFLFDTPNFFLLFERLSFGLFWNRYGT